MADVRGCDIPDELFYWPEKHIWARPRDDGTVEIGVTYVAQHLAKTIISASAKAAGRSVKKGRSLGTIESSKFVGPVTSPLTGEVAEANARLATEPGVINADPYGAGWFVRITPADWDGERGDLVTGDEALAAYRAVLEAEGIECGD